MYLFAAAGLTIVTECFFWGCFRHYRNLPFLVWCGAVNLGTNIFLNLALYYFWEKGDTLYSFKVIAGELCVIIAEFLLLAIFQKEYKKELFILNLCANLMTYALSFLFQ